MKKYLVRFLSTAGLLLFLLVHGCSFPPSPASSSPSPPPTSTHVWLSPTVPAVSPAPPGEAIEEVKLSSGSGGNLIMVLGVQDPTTLDPALVGDTTSAFVVFQLFSGLVRLDEHLEVQPSLAERWSISDDGRTYTFTLRQDACFADGTPITAEDVRYSFERATDPNLAPSPPARAYLGDIIGVREKLEGRADSIEGLRVIDARTIAITLDAPKSYFLSKLFHPTAYVVDRRTIERLGKGWTEQPNGSGPFTIEAWDHHARLVLKRNDNYPGNQAKLDRVTMLMGESASNPMVLYEQDKIDVVEVGAFSLARVRDASNPLSHELQSVPTLSLSYIGLNVTVPPFDDVRVRQAFSLLIDRKKLIEVTLQNSVTEARGILPPGMPGYNPHLPPLVGDIERARSLLAASKYASQFPRIAAYGGGWARLIRDIVKQENLGIAFQLRSYQDFGDYLAALKHGDQGEPLPMYSLSWIADYPDPENFLDVLFRTGSFENYCDYSNPEVDRLLDEAASEQQESRRWELYQRVEQIILNDMPIIPLYHDVEHVLVKPYVKGLVVTPMGILDLSRVELVRWE